MGELVSTVFQFKIEDHHDAFKFEMTQNMAIANEKSIEFHIGGGHIKVHEGKWL